MITRIVRLSFKQESVEEFLELFENTKFSIRSFEGCSHLELLKDHSNKAVFYTLSKWETADHLENYRKSTLFQKTWSVTKTLFSEKANAWSMVNISQT
jgi:quinol monooxygenase YgiN